MSTRSCNDGAVGVCHGARPDLTLALEDYVLILIPAACLLLLAPIRLRRIWSRSRKVVAPTGLWCAKTVSRISLHLLV
jgi:ATP-binding cassette subfamily C (CFTR/MRP) protein 1